MTKEELEKEIKNYIDKNCKQWETDGLSVDDIVRITVLDFIEPREKCIEELEAENARLKEDFKICEGNADNYYTRLMELQEQTIKATGIGLSCDNCNWNQFDEDEMCYCCSNKDKWELRR